MSPFGGWLAGSLVIAQANAPAAVAAVGPPQRNPPWAAPRVPSPPFAVPAFQTCDSTLATVPPFVNAAVRSTSPAAWWPCQSVLCPFATVHLVAESCRNQMPMLLSPRFEDFSAPKYRIKWLFAGLR